MYHQNHLWILHHNVHGNWYIAKLPKEYYIFVNANVFLAFHILLKLLWVSMNGLLKILYIKILFVGPLSVLAQESSGKRVRQLCINGKLEWTLLFIIVQAVISISGLENEAVFGLTGKGQVITLNSNSVV